MMMENYRSTPEILAAANSLISRNAQRIEKSLIPTLPHGPRVACHWAKDSAAEAEWIVTKIAELRSADGAAGHLYPLSRALCHAGARGSPADRGNPLYDIQRRAVFLPRRGEGRALLPPHGSVPGRSLLLRIANVPKRNLGERRMKFLKDCAAENGCTLYQALKRTVDDPIFPRTKARQFISLIELYSSGSSGRQISELLSALLSDSGYEEMLRTEGCQSRLDNLAELKQSIHEYEISCGEESTLEHYLAHVALLRTATWPPRATR